MTKEQQELKKKTLNRLYNNEKEQCMTIVTNHCRLCSGAGAVPFVGNAGALLPIHIDMIKKLGEVFNIELTDTEAQNLAVPPTGKVVGRSVGKFFTSMVPGVGSAVDAKLAYDVTDLWIAVDDFGVGLNDFDVVDMYDPHMVKIDRELLSDIDKHKDKQENVTGLLKKFHEKGIKVVAEGVETKEEFDWLVEAEADFFQGYYLHRPE